VRQYWRLKRFDDPGPFPQTLGHDTVLDPLIKEHLHTDADAKNRPAPGQAPANDDVAAYPPDALHARFKSSDTGHYEAVSRHGGLEI
jgi:hypothetical protein